MRFSGSKGTDDTPDRTQGTQILTDASESKHPWGSPDRHPGDGQFGISRELRKRLVLVHGLSNVLVNRMRFVGRHGGLYARSMAAGSISRMLLPKLEGAMVCPTIYGFDLVLDGKDGLAVYRFGFYEAGTLDIIRRSLRPGDIFMDVGCSIGMMSFMASRSLGEYGRVYSFEPDPRRYSHLLASIRINGTKNITALNHGIGDRDTMGRLYTDRGTPSMLGSDGTESYLEVMNRSLDSFVLEHDLRSVHFVKIDVEGYESAVVSGARDLLSRNDAPILCIEYNGPCHDTPGSSKDLLAFIRTLNEYQFFILEGTKAMISNLKRIRSSNEIPVGENVFCFLEHHRARLPRTMFVADRIGSGHDRNAHGKNR